MAFVTFHTQMTDCIIGTDLRCLVCGKPAAARHVRRNCPAAPRPLREPTVTTLPPGLGDMVANGLAGLGITKERAQAVASALGVEDCGCGKRQAALNKLGEQFGLPPGSTAEG